MYNGHGDVTALLDSDGNLVATYYYDAFGNIVEKMGNADHNMADKFTIDDFARQKFGDVMEELDFTIFHQHRWYKLIRDEVLLSFGAIPEGYGLYSLKMGLQPLFLGRFIPPAKEENSFWPPFYFEAVRLTQHMSYPKPKPNYLEDYRHEYIKQSTEILKTMPDFLIRPVFTPIIDIRAAYRIAIWLTYAIRRTSKDSPFPPTPENFYMECYREEDLWAKAYFRMYDEIRSSIVRLNESLAQQYNGRLPPRHLDYLDALDREDYGWFEQKLHNSYDDTLLQIKRKLHLEPDCKGSLWDEAYRKPVDIRGVLSEKYKECVREDYSIIKF